MKSADVRKYFDDLSRPVHSDGVQVSLEENFLNLLTDPPWPTSYLGSVVSGRCKVIGEGRGVLVEKDCAAVVWR